MGADGALVRIYRVARKSDGGKPGWWESLTDAERCAARMRTFEPQVVPGLLQHEDYIREIFRRGLTSSTKIDEQVAERLARQAVLAKDEPATYWAVIDESAIARIRHLPTRIAKAQVEHLLHLMELPHVTVQVLPASAGVHACMTGAFVLFSIPGRNEVCYSESATGEGTLVTDLEAVRTMEVRFDLMRGEALSPGASAQFMRDFMENL